MAEKNGTEAEQQRVAFKKGQREQHLELLAKNILRKDAFEEDLRKVKSTIKLCVEDLKLGGYTVDAQGRLDLHDDDRN